MQILTDQQEAFLQNERKTLNNLRVALVRFGALPEDTDTLGHSIEQLDDLFLLVIVGEFNAGKSALINALLGQKLLEEGVTPTTTHIQLLRYGETSSRTVLKENQLVLTFPSPMLSDVSIVDTPGTNAIIREHELITSQFVPQADLVLFVTSADRPFTESERQFLLHIRDWGKKVVMIINKMDILQSDTDREAVCKYVTENARALLGVSPDVFLASARKALLAKQGQPQLWEESGFAALEAYLHDRLDEKGRLHLKLLSPLGTASSLVNKYQQVIAGRLDLLKTDFQKLSEVESQLAIYDEDLKRDFRFRLADVENALNELEKRGDAFYDDTFRLARIVDLFGKDRIQREFEQKVVRELPQQIEQKVNEIIDWLVESQLRQWQAVVQHISERKSEYQEHLVGDQGGGSFTYDRERVMDAVGREARKVVDTFDQEHEAKLIAEDALATVATSLAVEVGAVGIGTLVTVLATTAAVDVTGIVTAGIIAALGLFIIPTRRRMAKQELSQKIAAMRTQLIQSLTLAFDRELGRSQEQIRSAVAPYDRFVRAESGKLQESQQQFDSLKTEIERQIGAVEQI